MKKTLLFIFTFLIMTCSSEESREASPIIPDGLTLVPDDNFEFYLETHNSNGESVDLGDPESLGDGVINNNYVVTEKIAEVTYLGIDNLNIDELTGIEDFISLQNLFCPDNNLTSLDLSNNLGLRILICPNNTLNSINVSQNTSLETIQILGNNLTSLNVSSLTELKSLDCSLNQINSLDLSNNLELLNMLAGRNQLTTLDLTNNTNLVSLGCNENQISSLDLSNNLNLETVICFDNMISSLNLANNIALNYLGCNDNQLTSLDLTNNPNLEGIVCENNELSSLNIANGNNASIILLEAINNPGLTCIEIDNGFEPYSCGASTPKWCKDAAANYSFDCL